MKIRAKVLACLLSIALSAISFKAMAQYDTVEVTTTEVVPSDTLFSGEGYKNYFKEVLETQPVEERHLDSSRVNKLRAEDAYWYANTAPPKEKPGKARTSFLNSSWFKTLFWILLVGAFVALLVWFLATSNVRLFSRRSRLVTQEAGEEELTENIFELDFEREIANAIASENYRLAIRLYYLQTLRKLADDGLISYTHEKTNSDYLFQLASGPHYRSFFRLTRNFEYVWYGKFELSRELFDLMQKDFTTFKQELAS